MFKIRNLFQYVQNKDIIRCSECDILFTYLGLFSFNLKKKKKQRLDNISQPHLTKHEYSHKALQIMLKTVFFWLANWSSLSCNFSVVIDLIALHGLHDFSSPTRDWTQAMATAPHSRALAWKIPWTEEPGRLQSMGSLRVGHD